MLGCSAADYWPALTAEEGAYFDGWLSFATDDSSYCFVGNGCTHDDWVDVQPPIPTLDMVHGGTTLESGHGGTTEGRTETFAPAGVYY